MNKNFVLFSLLFFMLACSSDLKTSIFSTEKFTTINLSKPAIEISFEDIAFNSIIGLAKDLNLARLVNSEYVYAILDNDLNLIKKIIKKEETNNFPMHFDYVNAELVDDKLKLSINDFQTENFLEFLVDLDVNSVELLSKIPYDKAGNIFTLFKLKDGNFITNCSNIDYSNMDYVRKYSSEFELLEKIPLNHTPDTDDLEYLWYNFNSTFTNYLTRIATNNFLISIPHIKELMLIDENLNIIKKIESPFNEAKVEEIINERSKFSYFSSPIASKNCIIIALNERISNNSDEFKTNLLFYSRNLDPLYMLNINHNLSNLSLSADESMLYAIDFKEEKTYIYDFDKMLRENELEMSR